MIETLILQTPLGLMLFRLSEVAVRWAEILPESSAAQATYLGTASALAKELARQVEAYFRGDRSGFTLPIDWQVMTEYQATVLRRVSLIAFGETTSYGKLAEALGQPGAARAVGLANSKNPCPLLIPCHRVIAADGAMQGYNAPLGILTKEWLLRHEGNVIFNHRLVNDQLPLLDLEGDN
ncbi:MAG: methylated-DNA--[protein]-cysteine S-methyltransferase [Anaerolineaceae bacterium]